MDKLKRPEGDSIFDHYFYRYFSRNIFTPFFLKTKITANQVSLLSLIVTIIGCMAVLFNYFWGLVGLLLISIGQILDLSDGEVARVKNQVSEFGAWFDSVTDRIKFAMIIFVMGFKWYLTTLDPLCLLITIFAVFNITMIGSISSIKKYVSFGEGTGVIKKKIYFGGGAVVIVFATISIIFQIYWLTIWFFAVIGMLMWVRQIQNHIKNARRKNII